jgi:hypothetical protein
MGPYYGTDYYGIKFLNKDGQELYKAIYHEKVKNEDIIQMKIKYGELKTRFGNIQIYIKLYPISTDDFSSTIDNTWVFIPESEF